MKPDMHPSVDLTSLWRRYDWRDSIFAPGMAILQALLPDGSTASGAGRARETALGRCLGETAEWHALRTLGADRHLSFSPWRDGIAAHPDNRTAREAALLEAYERFAVIGWWQGRLPANPVCANWLEEQEISLRLAAARIGAAQKRRTDIWLLASHAAPSVMVCRSTSLLGQQPILGYGCDTSPRRAAEKALRELLLMEVNLMELMAARSSGTVAGLKVKQRRIESFSRRCPHLLPATSWIIPGPDDLQASIEAASEWFSASVNLHDITPTGSPVAVWLSRPSINVPALDRQDGSPFL